MKPQEFVYYFKGAVELGELKEMNAQNFQKISNQLSKVKFDSSEAGMFCSWLKGVVDINENQTLNQKAFNLIVEKMNELGLDKSENVIKPNKSNQNVMRC